MMSVGSAGKKYFVPSVRPSNPDAAADRALEVNQNGLLERGAQAKVV